MRKVAANCFFKKTFIECDTGIDLDKIVLVSVVSPNMNA